MLMAALSLQVMAGSYEVLAPGPVLEADPLAGTQTDVTLLVTTVSSRPAWAGDLVRTWIVGDRTLVAKAAGGAAAAADDPHFVAARNLAWTAALRCVGSTADRSEAPPTAHAIQGASGGLLMALVHVASLRQTDPSGLRVAGTGVIDAEGRVLDVRRIAEKARAAVAADVDLFLAPVGLVGEARRAAPDLRVEGVGTLDEALRVLGEPGCVHRVQPSG